MWVDSGSPSENIKPDFAGGQESTKAVKGREGGNGLKREKGEGKKVKKEEEKE